jgi:hypothetical protein
LSQVVSSDPSPKVRFKSCRSVASLAYGGKAEAHEGKQGLEKEGTDAVSQGKERYEDEKKNEAMMVILITLMFMTRITGQ